LIDDSLAVLEQEDDVVSVDDPVDDADVEIGSVEDIADCDDVGRGRTAERRSQSPEFDG